MIGRTRSVVLTGVVGHVIEVEAHLAPSLPAFTLVGLPDASLNESRDRVRAAVTSSGLSWPQRRITVNLSPASLPKSGSVTDLAIAVAVLAGAGLIDGRQAAGTVHLGELGLDGQLRPVRGILPSVAAAVASGSNRIVVPAGNADEARLVPGAVVTAASSLAELAAAYGNDDARAAPRGAVPRVVPPARRVETVADLADVRGQPEARWALEVAAAGAHHLLMVGPPGAGKTMLASRLPGILPDLTPADALAATSIHSIAGTLSPEEGLLVRPPFEAPHHSASAAAIVGGGARIARPGAISRAHAGVLFLDEAPEFPGAVLQTLRQPLESGEIVLHRAYGAARYPARFQLVLAANPCPCGHFYGRGERCTCSALARRRYFSRLSGPLLDRVDIQVEVMPVARGASQSGEGTDAVAARVREARRRAESRFAGLPWSVTGHAPPSWL
ncbi:MAG: YifB family Mg chelatase-like AAA ATPase, partial [Demequinaceae bacterium]|nr:YifB family Mg chelatase-like AAA ATPase [Demequinaceae bacterium]